MPSLVREPHDLEDFIFNLQGRFRSSTTQNLVSSMDSSRIPTSWRGRPLASTWWRKRTLRPTHYIHNLWTTLKADDSKELGRQMCDAEQTKAADGKRPLNRHRIHELAPQQDREKVVRQSKLSSGSHSTAENSSL